MHTFIYVGIYHFFPWILWKSRCHILVNFPYYLKKKIMFHTAKIWILCIQHNHKSYLYSLDLEAFRWIYFHILFVCGMYICFLLFGLGRTLIHRKEGILLPLPQQNIVETKNEWIYKESSIKFALLKEQDIFIFYILIFGSFLKMILCLDKLKILTLSGHGPKKIILVLFSFHPFLKRANLFNKY